MINAMEEIIQYDKQLLLWFNGSDSLFLDSLIMTLTNAKTWIPLYLGLFYVVVKTNLKSNTAVRDILLVMAAAGVCVLLAGTIDDTIVTFLPCHERLRLIINNNELILQR